MGRWIFREREPGVRCVVVDAERWCDAIFGAAQELGTRDLKWDGPHGPLITVNGAPHVTVSWGGRYPFPHRVVEPTGARGVPRRKGSR